MSIDIPLVIHITIAIIFYKLLKFIVDVIYLVILQLRHQDNNEPESFNERLRDRLDKEG